LTELGDLLQHPLGGWSSLVTARRKASSRIVKCPVLVPEGLMEAGQISRRDLFKDQPLRLEPRDQGPSRFMRVPEGHSSFNQGFR
jgi:hypothetical protein